MSLYIAIVLAVPFVAAIGSKPRARLVLLLTIGGTWAVTLYAYERFVPDRDEVATALTFFLVYVHLIAAPVAGTLASMLLPRTRGIALPTVAALIGSVAAVALRYVVPTLFGNEHLERALDIIGPVCFASTFAVVVASLSARRTA